MPRNHVPRDIIARKLMVFTKLKRNVHKEIIARGAMMRRYNVQQDIIALSIVMVFTKVKCNVQREIIARQDGLLKSHA
jgi:uncharacterized circularly permuted ATP-grasp superfamily protein